MKSILKIFIVFIIVLSFTACQNQSDNTDASIEKVPEDYGDSIIVARDEFLNIFSEFDKLEIKETKTMARTDDAKTIIVEFTYTSENGDGVYGFIMDEDENGNAIITDHGTEITVDKLVNPNNE